MYSKVQHGKWIKTLELYTNFLIPLLVVDLWEDKQVPELIEV